MMGMMGGGAGAAAARKGTDKRSVDRGKKREDEIKAAESSKGLSLFDPYFNIVEVKIYGQARFYNPPPEEPEGEASPGQLAAETPKTEPATEPAKTDAAAKTEPRKPSPPRPKPRRPSREGRKRQARSHEDRAGESRAREGRKREKGTDQGCRGQDRGGQGRGSQTRRRSQVLGIMACFSMCNNRAMTAWYRESGPSPFLIQDLIA